MASKITLAQGAGGELMDQFIKQSILKYFKKQGTAEVSLAALDDAAVIDDIVFSTDSHTVQPLIFPGGDIGSLAVCGTINDVAVMGATPLASFCWVHHRRRILHGDLRNHCEKYGKNRRQSRCPNHHWRHKGR